MRTVYRILGVPILSIESDETTAEPELTAADNGGDLRSARIEVPALGFGQPQWDQGWEEDRRR